MIKRDKDRVLRNTKEYTKSKKEYDGVRKKKK